jgi:molybdate transport system substrate-binding protein
MSIASAKEPLRIAAASDLTTAFGELAALHGRRVGETPTLSFGSSGLLARQIEEGAPFDLFAAANLGYVDQVVASGACAGDSKLRYARGRLAMWSSGAPPKTPSELGDARYRKIAIANPAHAPYGKAAMQVLARLHLEEALKGKLVFGENVQQALQYAQSGNADVALVALSLVIAGKTPYTIVDQMLHEPIEQALVLCGKDAARLLRARAFVTTLQSPEGQAILTRYGFAIPSSGPSRGGP